MISTYKWAFLRPTCQQYKASTSNPATTYQVIANIVISLTEKMKTSVFFLLTLGLAFADPISKQTVSADNNQPPSLNCSESEAKHNEETNSNKGDSEQKNQVNENYNPIGDVVDEQIPNVEVFIEETVDLPSEFALQDFQADGDIPFDENSLPLTDDLYPNEVLEKNPDEIMEQAAGFAPLPFIRRRQKPRRKPTTRRHFVRNPYRRFYYAYPYYYGYYPRYSYYSPSSLRYY